MDIRNFKNTNSIDEIESVNSVAQTDPECDSISTECDSPFYKNDEMYRKSQELFSFGLESKCSKKIKSKSIKFSVIVKVILIPSRLELNALKSTLWWTVAEIESFRKDTYHEIKQCIEQNRCSLNEATMHLYQSFQPEQQPFFQLDASIFKMPAVECIVV